MDMPFMVALKFNSGVGSGGSGGKDGVGIASLDINDNGELVIVLTDGRVRNLGKIVGADGAVYVPHIDDQKVLSFTIEKNAEDVPDPVKLGGSGTDVEVVTDEEVKEMLEEVFGNQGGSGGGTGGGETGGDVLDESRVATDAEVFEMLEEVFGKSGGESSGSGGNTGNVNDNKVVTDAEMAEMLKEVFGS